MPSSSTFLAALAGWRVVMSRQSRCRKLLLLYGLCAPAGAPVVLVGVELAEVLRAVMVISDKNSDQ